MYIYRDSWTRICCEVVAIYMYIYRDSWGRICCEVVAIYMFICKFTEIAGVGFVVRLLPYIYIFVNLQR